MNKTSNILDTALSMVRNIGFESVSIAGLAKEVGMSKSGLFAHFNSKEKMHLMILDHAGKVFTDDVFRKSFSAKKGLPRLKEILKNWIAWYQIGGTCPFIAASVEYADRPGKVKDLIKSHSNQLMTALEVSIKHCIDEGHFRSNIEADVATYELYGIISGGLMYHRTLEHPNVENLFRKAMNNYIRRHEK